MDISALPNKKELLSLTECIFRLRLMINDLVLWQIFQKKEEKNHYPTKMIEFKIILHTLIVNLLIVIIYRSCSDLSPYISATHNIHIWAGTEL